MRASPIAGGGGGLFSPGGGARSTRAAIVVNSSMFHIVSVPLLILAALGCGFVVVYLKEVLLPFVISIFITYLLRPLVNVLTTPFAKMCPCFTTIPSVSNIHSRAGSWVRTRGGVTGYNRVDSAIGADGSDSEMGGSNSSNTGGGLVGLSGSSGVGAPSRRQVSRAVSPPKYPKVPQKIRQLATRALSGATELVAVAARGAGYVSAAASSAAGTGPNGSSSAAAGGIVSSSSGKGPQLAPSGSSGRNSSSNVADSRDSGNLRHLGGDKGDKDSRDSPLGSGRDGFGHDGDHGNNECGCCCGACRMTRCPRWFAILISLCIAAMFLAGLVLVIVDAVQTFERRSLRLYIDQAGKLANEVQGL